VIATAAIATRRWSVDGRRLDRDDVFRNWDTLTS
jgi:hypothetical protein